MPYRKGEDMLQDQTTPLNKNGTGKKILKSKISESERRRNKIQHDHFTHSNFFRFMIENWRFLLVYSIPIFLLLFITVNSTILLVSILKSSNITLENHQLLSQLWTRIQDKNDPAINHSSDLQIQNDTSKLLVNFSMLNPGNTSENPSESIVVVKKNKDPLTLLSELARNGPKFTCEIICAKPLIVKSYLRVNGEFSVWEAVGESNLSAKQEAAYVALKELYPAHILTELYHKKLTTNGTTEMETCLTKPVVLQANSTVKINRKC